MKRRPTTQDITWLLDLNRNNQLDPDPPYQRRSVWTRKDKQFFLDTIFHNYPSPAIFLHKTISDTGSATYHVVDGKQRTQTILEFVNGKIKMSSEFGNIRLDGKKWSDLQGELDLKQVFWNYQLTVEMIDIAEEGIINEVFDRLNRNARRLTKQELRHARFDGWLIKEAESETTREEWRALGVITASRAKRMVDSQFLSELMIVVLEKQIFGFDQDQLDEFYAKYDDPTETIPEFDEEEFGATFASVRKYLLEMEKAEGVITRYSKGFGNLYTLWALVALNLEHMPSPEGLASKYSTFMEQVETLAKQQDNLETFLRGAAPGEFGNALNYHNYSRGANTDLGPRKERLNVLQAVLMG